MPRPRRNSAPRWRPKHARRGCRTGAEGRAAKAEALRPLPSRRRFRSRGAGQGHRRVPAGAARNPRDAEAHYNLGVALAGCARFGEAVAHWRKAVRLQPGRAMFLNRLAWALATCPEDSVRKPDEAVALAERAVKLSRRRDPGLWTPWPPPMPRPAGFPRPCEPPRSSPGGHGGRPGPGPVHPGPDQASIRGAAFPPCTKP